ncbi:MAG: dipeptidase [Gemmatimonadetes bacterium]|nr:dipeptidase [Gemmatimonadota bacterium]MDA1103322.1 dipeptidase [Gemmatimonadota bacterium]
MKRVAFALVALALFAVLLGPTIVTRVAIPIVNPIVGTVASGDRVPSSGAVDLHKTLAIVDLHGDALLWDRSLLRRNSVGHVDLPRMIEGRIALQAFTVVTKAPFGLNIEANSDDSDLINLLSVLQGWPPRTWTSLLQRSLHQAHKLRDAAAASGGRLVLVESREELATYLRARADAPGTAPLAAAFLGIEGAHALEGDPANLERVFDAGFRMVGLTHFFDNAVGGSAHGIDKGGLTPLGRAVVVRMEELGIVVDLAHASLPLIDDVLDLATAPVVVSHTGVKGTCDNRRNLDDGRLSRIAATGGVVGVGLWPTAICGESPADWAKAVRHAVDVMGVDHVGLGSDWDGAVPAIIDAAGTVYLVEALLEEGFTNDDIAKIMGSNTIRVLLQTLPTRAR